MAHAEADLVQSLPRAHQHRKGPGADFSIKRAAIPLRYAVKFCPIIGDHPCKQIQPPGRAFGICNRLNITWQCQPLLQLDHINAALFQHRAWAQINLMHFKILQALRHTAPLAGQKGCAHAPCLLPQTQIQTGWLDLPAQGGRLQGDLARVYHLGNFLAGDDTVHGGPRQFVNIRGHLRVLCQICKRAVYRGLAPLGLWP